MMMLAGGSASNIVRCLIVLTLLAAVRCDKDDHNDKDDYEDKLENQLQQSVSLSKINKNSDGNNGNSHEQKGVPLLRGRHNGEEHWPYLGSGDDSQGHHLEDGQHGGHHGVALVGWQYMEYSSMFSFTMMLILAVVLKTFYHKIPVVSHILPESCALIVLGILFTCIVWLSWGRTLCNSNLPKFTSELFFHVLLPPIILDAAFTLYDRDFASNFVSVVTFAVVGTILNILAIGYSLYGLSYAGLFGNFTVQRNSSHPCPTLLNSTYTEHQLAPVEALIFSSLISAVDPVAVLAIFDEIKVNTGLYFLVFGESLFNDGVTVVLYNNMKNIEEIPVGPTEIIMTVLSFVFVVFGGLLIGVFHGALASYLTKKTKDARAVEPLLVLALGYLSFIVAEIVHWSGILAIIGFGLTTKRYAFINISCKSYTTIKYSTKTLASISDVVIFLFMGMVWFSEEHHLHPAFMASTIALCTMYRFIITFFLSWLTNMSRGNKINAQEQFIIAYGGLRGAVGFSLAVVIGKDKWYRELFVSTALAMVIFTVFIQGSTIKYFVKLLHITLKKKDEVDSVKAKLTPEIQLNLMDDIMGGIEALVGRSGHNKLFLHFKQIDEKYIRPHLICPHQKEKLEHMFDRVVLEDHYKGLYGPRIIARGIIDDAEDQKNPAELKPSLSADREAFSVAISSQSWSQFKNKFDSSVSADENQLIRQMENKKDRLRTMESKIIQDKDEDEGGEKSAPLRPQSGSAGQGKRLSRMTSIIMDEYSRISDDKRTNRLTTQISQDLRNIPDIIIEEEEEQDKKKG